jgi:hypothetical protein
MLSGVVHWNISRLTLGPYRLTPISFDVSERDEVKASQPVNLRKSLEVAVSEDQACALFGQGYANLFWDSEKKTMRSFPDNGKCGLNGQNNLLSPTADQTTFKMVCAMTGPTTADSCGENSYEYPSVEPRILPANMSTRPNAL